MRRIVILFTVFLLAFSAVEAQNDADNVVRDILELWADQNDDESVPDDVVEQLYNFLDNPLNINDTSSDGLILLPFLSDFHRAAIRAYVAQNGEILSLSELYLLNGFDSSVVRLMMPFVTVAPNEKSARLSLKEIIDHGHSNLRFGAKTVQPTGRGYNEDIYAGSPFRMYFRYYFKYRDRITFQLSGDKDAGEAFRFVSAANSGAGVGQAGFDYYGYHLMFNDFGIVKRAIIGKYNLHFGQGVTLWSGSAPWMSGNMPLRRYGQGITPASAFCEYGYLRGAAVTLNIRPTRLEMTLFVSDVDRDATLSSRDTLYGGEQLYQSLYMSGYHRTATEIAKKGMLGEKLFGSHIQYNGSNLQIGATAVKTILDSPLTPVEYVYNTFAFSGKDNLNAGVDITYRYRRLLLFSEVAVSSRRSRNDSDLLPVAGVGGMQLHLNADNMLSAALHYGSPTYQNLHSNIIGQSSQAQNEEGILCFFHTRLPGYVDVQTSVDFFRFPTMRYRIYSPSTGVDYRVKVTKPLAKGLSVLGQYRYRSSQRNSDGQLYAVEDIVRSQLQLSLDYDRSPWHLVSRVVYSKFNCQDHAPQEGFLMSQDATYHFSLSGHPFSVGGRLSVFDVSGYDARIFAYENDLMYEFSVPMFNGRGVRFYMLGRWEVSDDVSVALKYAVSFYPDNETLGSGYEVIEGNHRHEFKVQMRLKF
ncbi:MAG: hypothetical protein K5842_02615 [Bacteroidales bacterium]|nr:hypothetical protein [Bacteroidales bacterium]